MKKTLGIVTILFSIIVSALFIKHSFTEDWKYDVDPEFDYYDNQFTITKYNVSQEDTRELYALEDSEIDLLMVLSIGLSILSISYVLVTFTKNKGNIKLEILNQENDLLRKQIENNELKQRLKGVVPDSTVNPTPTQITSVGTNESEFQICPQCSSTNESKYSFCLKCGYAFKNPKSSQVANNLSARKKGMFRNPLSFNGRIRRTEYAISLILYIVPVFIINIYLDKTEEPGPELLTVALIYILIQWFIWAQGAKRCHDIGRAGWFQLIPFYMIYLVFAESDRAINEYGTTPK